MILRVVESIEAIATQPCLRRDKTILLPLLPVCERRPRSSCDLAGLAVLHSFSGVNVITVLGGLGIAASPCGGRREKTVENFIGSITYTPTSGAGGDFCRFGRDERHRRGVGLALHTGAPLDRTSSPSRTGRSPTSSSRTSPTATASGTIPPSVCATRPPRPDPLHPVEVPGCSMRTPRSTRARRACGSSASAAPRWTSRCFSYVTVTDANEYLEVAEDLNPRLMDIVSRGGLELAFPSQTTYSNRARARCRPRRRLRRRCRHA